jgi:ribonuclease VapC
MIVVDSSALLAIIFDEPERQSFEDSSPRRAMPPVGGERHETACVLRARHGPIGVARLWRLLEDSEVEIVAFDEAQMRVAAAAFDRYGKGVDSKARLNLADCAAYALAKTLNAPLLYKGYDFAATDLIACTLS